MDATRIEAILGRRSIRSWRDEPVDDAAVELLLRAAMAAPSAGNQQPWRFVVVRDRQVLARLAAASPYAQMLPAAPLALVVCGDAAAEVHPGFWVQDCSAAVQNLLLAAHALGLGAVWLGYHPREDRVRGAQAALGLPDTVIPLAVVPVGWPAEPKPPADRYDPAKVRFDRW
jgi:nitroreductase